MCFREECRNAYDKAVCICVCVCLFWQQVVVLLVKRACRGEEAPSPASSWPSHKWGGCTEKEKKEGNWEQFHFSF